jgi:hypothetical protein
MKANYFLTMFVIAAALAGCGNREALPSIARGQVVEYAPILLKDSVTEETLLQSSEVLQRDFLVQQPGFIQRLLVKKSAREFVDIVVWESQAHADQAMTHSLQSKACQSYFSCMKNVDGSDVVHLPVVAVYAGD